MRTRGADVAEERGSFVCHGANPRDGAISVPFVEVDAREMIDDEMVWVKNSTGRAVSGMVKIILSSSSHRPFSTSQSLHRHPRQRILFSETHRKGSISERRVRVLRFRVGRPLRVVIGWVEQLRHIAVVFFAHPAGVIIPEAQRTFHAVEKEVKMLWLLWVCQRLSSGYCRFVVVSTGDSLCRRRKCLNQCVYVERQREKYVPATWRALGLDVCERRCCVVGCAQPSRLVIVNLSEDGRLVPSTVQRGEESVVVEKVCCVEPSPRRRAVGSQIVVVPLAIVDNYSAACYEV